MKNNVRKYWITDRLEAVSLENGDGGLLATILPGRGGTLISFKKDGEEYIYCDWDNLRAEERPRCGMPVLFPVCGRPENGVFRFAGREYPMTIHGVAQFGNWAVADMGCDEAEAWVRLCLRADNQSRKAYPFDFQIELTYTLRSGGLYVYQRYCCLAGERMPFSFGFHPYFCISSLDRTEFAFQGKELWIPSEGRKEPAPERFCFQTGEAQEYGAMISDCKGWAALQDAETGHKVEIDFGPEFSRILLWSRPEKHFACIEPWSAPADAYNTAPEALSWLEAGESLHTWLRIRIGSMEQEERG